MRSGRLLPSTMIAVPIGISAILILLALIAAGFAAHLDLQRILDSQTDA